MIVLYLQSESLSGSYVFGVLQPLVSHIRGGWYVAVGCGKVSQARGVVGGRLEGRCGLISEFNLYCSDYA